VHSYEWAPNTIKKVQKLKRENNFSGNSGSFKIENHASRHSPSEKENSPTFGTGSNEEGFSGGIVPFGNQANGQKEAIRLKRRCFYKWGRLIYGYK
jgi:hypothetical protein